MIQKEHERADDPLSPLPPHKISERICEVDYYKKILTQKESQEQDKRSNPASSLTLPHQISKLIRQAGYVKVRSLDREEEEEKANACPCYDCNKKKIQ